MGLVLSIITLLITNTFLLRGDYAGFYRIRIRTFVKYVLVVIGQVFHSGFKAIRRILNGQDTVTIDEFKSGLDQDLPLALLATAVTLTPGTVTVGLKDSTLLILRFKDSPSDTASPSDDWKPLSIESILMEERS